MTLKRAVAILIALAAIMFASFLLLRGIVLEKAISKVQQKVKSSLGVDLLIEKAYFESFARVGAEHIYLIPANKDTLFYCNKAAISFSLWRLIKGQPPLNNIVLKTGYLQLVEMNDSISNFNFLFEKNKKSSADNDTIKSAMNYRELASSLWHRAFGLADFNFNMTDFEFRWIAPGYREVLQITECRLQKTLFAASVTDSLATGTATWKAEGIIDPDAEIFQLKAASTTDKIIPVPFFEKISGISYRLHSFELLLDGAEIDNDYFKTHLVASAFRPAINHWRISPIDVKLDSIKLNFHVSINDSAFAFDTTSQVLVNRLPIHTGFEISKNIITLVNLKVRIPEVDANTFFTSLPSGLFSTLEGINASGQLKYRLDFRLNPTVPDSLHFDSELKGNKFRVTKFGNENFAAINGQFIYVAQDKDRILSVFPVGPENPDFVPLTEISPLLVNSVLTAEDGTFRFHRGFNEEAFRQSIATNIKERRFARGGSTITMQLVKNVFLNRNKTVSRKLEEAIIVWMIESTGIVSKDRMLEVYLNIIEWGPGIFGIGEASQFYFSKHPSQLTLEESIFLSSIIPNPKAFRYSFDKQGMLREYLQYYFKLVAGRLARKEIITQEQLDQLKFGVELKGPALQYVVPADTIPADTIPTDFEPLFFENL